MLPQRNVKYITGGALRRLQEANNAFGNADGNKFEDAFNIYIDMLVEFSSLGYLPEGYVYPDSDAAAIGYEIPHSDLIYVLVVKAASFFDVPLVAAHYADYARAMTNIAMLLPVPEIACNNIPVNYANYDSFHMCSDETVDNCLETESGFDINV